MKRAFLLSLAFLCLRDVRASVSCSSTPCADGAAAAGVTSPVPTDPVVFNGAATFDKQITATLGIATPATGAANAIETGETAGCQTYEGPTADGFETRVCGGESTRDGQLLVTTTLAAGVELSTPFGGGVFEGVSLSPGTYAVLKVDGPNFVKMRANAILCWAAGGPSDVCDFGIVRIAASVARVTDGSATNRGWLQQAGEVSLASDFTNATATMANTALSATLIASGSYTFALRLFASDSTAADGLKIDFDGGAATATDFRAHCTIFDTALLASTQTTAIATDFTVAVATGASLVECYGSITANAAGTFIVRAAQNAHTAGTLTVNRGSYLWMRDVTP